MKNYVRSLFFCSAAMSVFFTACKKTEVQKNESISFVTDENSQLGQAVFNPWGVLITSSTSSPSDILGLLQQDISQQDKIALAQDYGVKYIRTSVDKNEWDTDRTGFLRRYDNFTDKGFSMLLTITWADATTSGGVLIPAEFPKNATSPTSPYFRFITAMVDSLTAKGHVPPAVIVVENEETNKTFHRINDTTDNRRYLLMIEAVTSICHPKGIKVSNGGITLRALTYTAWDWLKNVRHREDEAQEFAFNSMPPSSYYTLYKPKPADISYAGLDNINSQIAMVQYYIDNYKNISFDYLNFHWYEPAIARGWLDNLNGGTPWSRGISKNDTSAGALGHVLQYLNAVKEDKKVISNEIGQVTQSDCLTRKLMKKIQSRPYYAFSIASWYDGDGTDAYDAKAMHNSLLALPFFTKRNTGITFEKLISNPDGFPSCSPLQ